MADNPSGAALFDAWKKQIEEGTQKWTQFVSQMGSPGRSAVPDPLQFWRPFMDPGMASWSTVFSQAPATPELLTQWKEFLDQWIAAWTKAQEQAMGTDAFAKALGQYLDQWLSMQGPAKKMAEQSAEANLQMLGLPSRDQVVAIAQQLMDLDDRIDGLDDRLDALLARIDRLSQLIEDSRRTTARAAAPRKDK